MAYFFLCDGVKVDLASFCFFEEFIERHGVGSGSEAIFDVNFVEERDHVFGLILGVIQVLYTIENDHDYYLVRHNTSLVQKLLVALLDSLNGSFEHMLRLTVNADTDRQLYPSFLRSSKQRNQPVACRMTHFLSLLRVHVEPLDLSFIDFNGPDGCFFVLIRVIFIARDDPYPLVAIEPDFLGL